MNFRDFDLSGFFEILTSFRCKLLLRRFEEY